MIEFMKILIFEKFKIINNIEYSINNYIINIFYQYIDMIIETIHNNRYDNIIQYISVSNIYVNNSWYNS